MNIYQVPSSFYPISLPAVIYALLKQLITLKLSSRQSGLPYLPSPFLPLSFSREQVMKTNSFKIYEPRNFIWIIYVHYPSASRHFAKLFMVGTHLVWLPGQQ